MKTSRSLLTELNTSIADPPQDPKTRKELYTAANTLSAVLEDRHDTISRLIYSPINITIALVANNLQIFNLLVEKCSPIPTSDLATRIGAHHVLGR